MGQSFNNCSLPLPKCGLDGLGCSIPPSLPMPELLTAAARRLAATPKTSAAAAKANAAKFAFQTARRLARESRIVRQRREVILASHSRAAAAAADERSMRGNRLWTRLVANAAAQENDALRQAHEAAAAASCVNAAAPAKSKERLRRAEVDSDAGSDEENLSREPDAAPSKKEAEPVGTVNVPTAHCESHDKTPIMLHYAHQAKPFFRGRFYFEQARELAAIRSGTQEATRKCTTSNILPALGAGGVLQTTAREIETIERQERSIKRDNRLSVCVSKRKVEEAVHGKLVNRIDAVRRMASSVATNVTRTIHFTHGGGASGVRGSASWSSGEPANRRNAALMPASLAPQILADTFRNDLWTAPRRENAHDRAIISRGSTHVREEDEDASVRLSILSASSPARSRQVSVVTPSAGTKSWRLSDMVAESTRSRQVSIAPEFAHGSICESGDDSLAELPSPTIHTEVTTSGFLPKLPGRSSSQVSHISMQPRTPAVPTTPIRHIPAQQPSAPKLHMSAVTDFAPCVYPSAPVPRAESVDDMSPAQIPRRLWLHKRVEALGSNQHLAAGATQRKPCAPTYVRMWRCA
ncbi:hypothetical protein HDU84_007481 [Entophlyctis sp. JEL0112]|nr:hypothetical protein HDU84_007481 [Entophlyctis sp. JEL0112]